LVLPSAQPRTIRQRWARFCALLDRRDQRTSVSRSSSDNVNSASGPPVRAIRQIYTSASDFRRRTLCDRAEVLSSVTPVPLP
jgi:hypothetical protein